jgi:hypothetical protein
MKQQAIGLKEAGANAQGKQEYVRKIQNIAQAHATVRVDTHGIVVRVPANKTV